MNNNRTGPSTVKTMNNNTMNSPYNNNSGGNNNMRSPTSTLMNRNVRSMLPPVNVRHGLLRKIVTQDMNSTNPNDKLKTLNKLRSLIKRNHDVNGELWDVLPHILHWYFGGGGGKSIYDQIDDQVIPKRRREKNDTSRMDSKFFPLPLPVELSLLSMKGKHGVQVEGSLFFELFCNETLAFHKSKRKLWFSIKNLPDAVVRSIEEKIGNMGMNMIRNGSGNGIDDDPDLPILIHTYVDILQQTPDDTIDLYNSRNGNNGLNNARNYNNNTNNTMMNGGGINSMSGGRVLRNIKRIQLPLEEYYILTFLLSIVSSKGNGNGSERRTISSPSSYSALFSSNSRGAGNAQRNKLKKKMYSCLLKYGVVEYRQLEPYVELLYQCFRRFLPLSNEDQYFNSISAFGEDFFIDHVILCWLWPISKKKDHPFKFTKKLGVSITCLITYIINRDYEQLIMEGNSRTFEIIRIHIYNMLLTIFGNDGINGSAPDEFSMSIDIWLLVLMPWLAKESHDFEGRNLGVSNIIDTASQDVLNPLASNLRKKGYGSNTMSSPNTEGGGASQVGGKGRADMNNAERHEKKHHGKHDAPKTSCHDDAAPYAFDENKWIPYILVNYSFYSVLFEKFVSNILSMDFMSKNNSHLELVERVLYVFTPQLRNVLHKCSVFLHYDECYFDSSSLDENVLFACKKYSEHLLNPTSVIPNFNVNNHRMVGGGNSTNNAAGKISSLFLQYERNGKGDDIARKLQEVSVRAGQSGSLYMDTIKFLEKEHQPSWNALGQLDDKGLQQVRAGTRIASNMRWVEKNGMFKWRYDANLQDFILIDPLDEPLYSYEIPFLTKILILLSKKFNKWLKYDFKGNDLIDYGPLKNNTIDMPQGGTNGVGMDSNNISTKKNNNTNRDLQMNDENDPSLGNTDDNGTSSALATTNEEIYVNPWDNAYPEFSFYHTALFGASFLGVKKTLSFGNVQERIRRLERMNHDIFMIPSKPPKAFIKSNNEQKSKSKKTNSNTTDETNKKKKKGRKKKVDPRNLNRCCGAQLKFPRYKFRIDLRFLGDFRLYLGLFTLYMLLFNFLFPMYGFLYGEEDGSDVNGMPKRPRQKQIGMEQKDAIRSGL